jgi:hypothetical protein
MGTPQLNPWTVNLMIIQLMIGAFCVKADAGHGVARKPAKGKGNSPNSP